MTNEPVCRADKPAQAAPNKPTGWALSRACARPMRGSFVIYWPGIAPAFRPP